VSSNLVADLNRVVKSGALFRPDRFLESKMSAATHELWLRQPLGVDLIQFNRLLLLDVFSGMLARNPKGDEIHGVGDEVFYHSGNNPAEHERVELSGHPKLQQPGGWVSARDKIMVDRTTGVSQLIGQPHFHSRTEQFGGIKTPGANKKF
jgi:hypothetical protein